VAQQDAFESRWPDIPDITLIPAVARLPAMFPAERRHVAARDILLRRIRSEFEEMPELSLTLVQAIALLGFAPDASSRILLRRTKSACLRLRSDSRYVLRTQQP
jgi:hypothetical protein